MGILYPIFLQDRDKYMYVIESALELNRELERIDIEENEYKAWDTEGKSLELYIDEGEIKVKVSADSPRLNELKEAILNYANTANPKVIFSFSDIHNDIIKLFHAVEEHIAKKK